MITVDVTLSLMSCQDSHKLLGWRELKFMASEPCACKTERRGWRSGGVGEGDLISDLKLHPGQTPQSARGETGKT